ncbi:cell division protein FtsQ/DivIB [Dasania sp. GY-MA-18]|uniref:Cell division protein FtsQ n=1 Tax=Dasania phycosphaerae TaxID=2950436 RepID=A0A9J6RPT1_9GAMM|nr:MULTISPECIES: cell division protein FtsQ/DivIB [Dasania]MCR8923685.1 cell division protein FtsQ/DivIB [Dasania sp. GY-MA-18]MCZ0866119.1 cell division protein FtsQ/DivIB [Dasania phycosphaerae]MCZ0869843.1 cell division protein FtsQ/DivIB [Dasania phycosphaerae]
MQILKPKKQRGAVIKGAPKPSRASFPWRRLQPLVFVVLLLLSLGGLYQGGVHVLNQPIDKVAVAGELRYVNKEAVIAEVSPFLQQGFVRIDMAAIRKQLQQLPWVYEVRVRRQWPNEVAITIVEQQAIAQWGQRGFLNHRGELFKPKPMVKVPGLPLLAGPDESSKTVMANYRAVGELLRSQGLELSSFQLSARGSWLAILKEGVSLSIGRDQLMEKMQRFVYVYQKTLAGNLAAIKSIDMRYSNGLAVSWRQQT